MTTEPLYQSLPPYRDDDGDASDQLKSIVITFKRPAADGSNGNDDDTTTNNKRSDSTVMTVHLRNDDTILSLSKRIRVRD